MPRSREELAEALREAAGRESANRDGDFDTLTSLLEAADLLDSLEEAFRVVADEGPLREGFGVKLTDPGTRDAAEQWASAEHWPTTYENVRIQRRAETPWTDVEEGTDGV